MPASFNCAATRSQSSGRACWLTRKRAAQFRRQSGERFRHDLGENPRPLAAAGNQDLDRRAGLRRPILGPGDREHSPAAPDCRYARRGRCRRGRSPAVAANPVAICETRLASSRLARPSTAFCSWIAVGTPSWIAASIVGIEGYPPNPTTASGDRRRNSRRACTIPIAISAAPRAARIGPPPMPPGPDLTDLDPRHRPGEGVGPPVGRETHFAPRTRPAARPAPAPETDARRCRRRRARNAGRSRDPRTALTPRSRRGGVVSGPASCPCRTPAPASTIRHRTETARSCPWSGSGAAPRPC